MNTGIRIIWSSEFGRRVKLLSTFVVIFLEKCLSSNFGVTTQLVLVIGNFYFFTHLHEFTHFWKYF